MTVSRRVQLARGVLSATAIVGVALVWLAAWQLHPTYGSALATVVAAVALWWLRGVFSRRRVVLWLEERVPELRFALASLEYAPASPFRAALERRVADARFTPPVTRAALQLIGAPLMLLLVALLVVRPIVERVADARSARAAVGANDPGPAAMPGAGRLVARVTTPAYAGGRSQSLTNPVSVTALVGSGIRFSGDWTHATTMPAEPVALTLEGGRGTRVVALEPIADSTPRVVLQLPARDTLLPTPSGGLRLAAEARDDIGLVDAWFEIIVSSGSGESFVFRSTVLGRTNARNGRRLTLSAVLPLDSLALKPGDVVHLRAVARDAKPAPTAETGSSETRTLRIPRPGEDDSVSVIPIPPPEVGQSELSQRMLIILTERLVARMDRLSRDEVRGESGNIAREQGRLRKRVGEIIFMRLTGGEEDDHDEELDDVMADTVSPSEALLRAADAATNIEMEHDHGDEGPVVAVNRPLLEAFNHMWDAERQLSVGAPRAALPPMRAALEAIQRARAAERIYLRGRPPRVVIDEAKVRLAGKRDEIDPAARSPRASALRERLARRARFRSVLRLLAGGAAGRGAARVDPGSASQARADAAAAVDSLLVLRIDVLDEEPGLAAALAQAITDLRAGRDATNALLAVRRALDGAPVAGAHSGWSGAW